MPKEQVELLNLRRLPGRLSAQQVAWITGIPEYGLPFLVKAGLLKRLGPASKTHTVAWFSSAAVLRLIDDEQAMSKATALLVEVTREKNKERLKRNGEFEGFPGDTESKAA